jgi:hypothetical protein
MLHTKKSLQRWNYLHFGKIQAWIKSTLAKLDNIQKSPPSLSSFSLETSLKTSFDDLLLKEEILWKSKSRELWLSCSDLNTKFFHTSTVIKRRSNVINFLKTDLGSWLSDRATIGASFVSRFTNLFCSTNPPIADEVLDLFSPVISEDNSLNLHSIPFESEVIQALSSLGSSKAPGLDGFTALFYKKYWSHVSKDVLACVRHFFQFSHLLQELNHTFITPVPKKTISHTVHHFRPTSLSNIAYKIISKILANRLKNVFPKIISPLQSTFVPSRNIHSNSILAHELIHTFKNKRGKKGFMFLKIDMEKAFDQMEW